MSTFAFAPDLYGNDFNKYRAFDVIRTVSKTEIIWGNIAGISSTALWIFYFLISYTFRWAGDCSV